MNLAIDIFRSVERISNLIIAFNLAQKSARFIVFGFDFELILKVKDSLKLGLRGPLLLQLSYCL